MIPAGTQVEWTYTDHKGRLFAMRGTVVGPAPSGNGRIEVVDAMGNLNHMQPTLSTLKVVEP